MSPQQPVNQLSKDLGIEDLSPQEQQMVLADFSELVQAKLSQKLAAQMSSEELDKFDQLGAEGDEAKLVAYLEQRFPNYQEILNLTIQESKDDLSGQAERLRIFLKNQPPDNLPPSQ